jgi:integrase
MFQMARSRITKLLVENSEARGTDYFLWDTDVRGFGVKISAGGKKTYVCQYRTLGGRAGRTRRFFIGRHGSPWTAEMARDEARKLLGSVAHGEDPATAKQSLKRRMTISELCDQYAAHGCPLKKASTLATDVGRIKRHIKPLIGNRFVEDITRGDVMKFLQDIANGSTKLDEKTRRRGRSIVRGGRGTASRTVGLLGAIYTYAISCEIVEHNPCRGIARFPDRKCMRFLSQEEIVRLGRALRDAAEEGENLKAVAIIKLLAFTGARKGEIEQLKWFEVDLDKHFLRFADSKTGQKIIPINQAAVSIIAAQRPREGNPFVFPADRSDSGFFEGMPKIWRRVRKAARLEDVRIHDLRHSFASVAVAGGASLPIIGALLGHKDTATTQRYAHLSADPLRAASQAVADAIAQALEGSTVEASTTEVPNEAIIEAASIVHSRVH